MAEGTVDVKDLFTGVVDVQDPFAGLAEYTRSRANVRMNARSRFPWRPRLIAAAISIARTTKSLKIAARTTG